MDYLAYATKKIAELAVANGGDKDATIKAAMELAETDDNLRLGLLEAGVEARATRQ